MISILKNKKMHYLSIVIALLIIIAIILFCSNLYIRHTIEKKYHIYHLAKENLVDPDKLTSNIERQMFSSTFDPYSNLQQYSKIDWEKEMTKEYGKSWKKW